MAVKKELRRDQLAANRLIRLRRNNAFKHNVARFGLQRAKFIAVFMRDILYGPGVRPGRARRA